MGGGGRESEGKRTLGSVGPGWEDNIKLDVKWIEWESLEWIDLAQLGTSVKKKLVINS